MKGLFLILALVILVSLLSSCAPTATPSTIDLPTTTPSTPTTESSSAIHWSDAKGYVGERETVYGPVVDTHWASTSNGKPTFLNIGKPYPDSKRFTVVIWIQNRGNFPQAPEVYYLGKTIYVTGLITTYGGVAQIEAKSPNQIREE